jgi:hypothetical protein
MSRNAQIDIYSETEYEMSTSDQSERFGRPKFAISRRGKQRTLAVAVLDKRVCSAGWNSNEDFRR